MTKLVQPNGAAMQPTPEQIMARAQGMAAQMMAGAKDRVAAQKDVSQFYSPNELPDPEGDILQPLGWQVFVRPLAPPEKSGSVMLPDSFKEVVEYTTCVGRIVRIGNMAWKREDMINVTGWPQVGDFVTYPRYAGGKYVIGGIKYLLLSDTDILAKVPSPDAISRM